MILHDSTYDPSVILNVLVRWDRKILRSYDLDRDFDNHAIYITYISNNSHICPNMFLQKNFQVFKIFDSLGFDQSNLFKKKNPVLRLKLSGCLDSSRSVGSIFK